MKEAWQKNVCVAARGANESVCVVVLVTSADHAMMMQGP